MHDQPSPSNGKVSLQQVEEGAVRSPLHHTSEVEGWWEKGIPACFLPSSSPSRKSTLASSHRFLNRVLKFLWVNTAPSWLPYNARATRGVTQTQLNTQRLLLIHYEQAEAISAGTVNIFIPNFGKYSFKNIIPTS